VPVSNPISVYISQLGEIVVIGDNSGLPSVRYHLQQVVHGFTEMHYIVLVNAVIIYWDGTLQLSLGYDLNVVTMEKWHGQGLCH